MADTDTDVRYRVHVSPDEEIVQESHANIGIEANTDNNPSDIFESSVVSFPSNTVSQSQDE